MLGDAMLAESSLRMRWTTLVDGVAGQKSKEAQWWLQVSRAHKV